MTEENEQAAVTSEKENTFYFDVFPIRVARENAEKYFIDTHMNKFVNKIISNINHSIGAHSVNGESGTQIVLSCLEIFGDYPINKHLNFLESVTNAVKDKYTDGGYTIISEKIETDWGVKGFVFTINWQEEDINDDEEGDDNDGE